MRDPPIDYVMVDEMVVDDGKLWDGKWDDKMVDDDKWDCEMRSTIYYLTISHHIYTLITSTLSHSSSHQLEDGKLWDRLWEMTW